MDQFRTPRFERSFWKFSNRTQDAFEKQLRFLLKDIRHPSLRAKKYDESKNIWQARVSNNVRFYFLISGTYYIILDIEKHRD